MAVEIHQPKPLKYLYEKGLLTKGEFRTLAQPLETYLTERGFKRNVRIYGALLTRFPEEIFPEYKTHLNYQQVRYPFSVDTQIMDTKIEEFNDAVDEILRNGQPVRSESEKREYRMQLLREPQEDGTFTQLSADEAFLNMWRFGKYVLGRLDPEVKEEIVAGSIEGMMPFLQGERGNFESFRNFIRYFRVVVINARNSYYKGRKREYRALNRLAKQVDLYTPSSVETSEDSTLQKFTITDEDISRFSPRQLQVFTLIKSGFKPNQIASFLNLSRSAIDGHLDGIRNKLRIKNNIKKPLPDEVIVSKFISFRKTFFKLFGRYPNSFDFVKGHKKGWVDLHLTVFIRRFSNSSWSIAQNRMLQIAEDKGLI